MELNHPSNNYEQPPQNEFQPADPPQPDSPQIDKPHKLDRQQKISLAIISIIGIGVLIFGFWQFKNGVNIPLPDFSKDKKPTETAALEDTRDETLKNQDTDEDGLIDYDEVYVYNTSPYLQDTDSDGYLDKEEIENGYDPNCPAGQNCFSEVFEESTSLIPEDSSQMTPNEIRAQLLDTGLVDEQTLNSIDDKTLMQLFEETVGAEESSKNNIQNPANYTPDQIRNLLIESGLEEEFVNSIDDEALMEMYEESLKEVDLD